MQLSMDKRFSTRKTNEICKRIALSLLVGISDEATRENLTDFVVSDNFRALCDYPASYALSTSDVLVVRQVLALYQKRADLDLGIDKEEVAWSSFKANEVKCAAVNAKFRHLGTHLLNNPEDRAFEPLLYEAQRKISKVLGLVPDIADMRHRFGPGATTGCQKRMASWKNKFSEPLACSEDLIQYLPSYLEEVPAWCEVHDLTLDGEKYVVPVSVTHGNLVFVPKNAKTLRSVVVEPTLNSFFQLGVGSYIGERLRRVGIDVKDQTANQRSAMIGSISGELATLDLSNASDTIARELVYHLLPFDWAVALDGLRTSTVAYGDCTFKLQKFSSMGNGYTFALETLIFWALASSASDSDPRVLAYGDDLVVPTQFYEITCRLLEFCGFTVNLAKSYASGPFRESCGKDYLSGIDVRPVYVKDQVNYLDLFRLHNAFVRRRDWVTASLILDVLPESIRLWGPDGYGDGHLITDHQVEHLRPHRRDLGWSGYIFDTYVAKPRRDFRRLPGDRVLPTYSIYVSGNSGPTIGDVLADYLDGYLPFSEVEMCIEEKNFTPHTKARPATRIKPEYDGTPSATLPGDRGYKRVSIYTLIPPN